MPKCSRCSAVKPDGDFHRDRHAAYGRREQIAAHHRAYKIKRQYGITEHQFNAMFEGQVGRCAICSDGLLRGKKGGLAIDHCHATGKVRGLLCHRCNTGLGLFRDRSELLLRAVEYVSGNAIVAEEAAEVIGALLDVLEAA